MAGSSLRWSQTMRNAWRPSASCGRSGKTPLQARVDLVRLANGTLALMELEAIEPSLYFRMHPEAPRHFADAVQRWLGRDNLVRG